MALSRATNGMTRPMRWRSSGTCASPSRRRRLGERGALQADLSRLHRPDAGECLEELRLAVAGDAGNPDDLALPHREAHALDALDAEPVLDHEVRHLEHWFARERGRLVDAQAHR